MVITKTLDVKLAGSQWITEAVKGEANARTLHIAFEEEGSSLSLENVAHAYLYARKPSGQYSLINSCTINADNTIDYVETAQTCAEQGIMLCTLVLVDEDGATLYSPQFTIHIFPNEMDQSGIVSASEFTAINEQVASADDSRKRAEAWAVGTMDGEPVPSDDETYENNSKYYAEQAEQIKNETQGIADDVEDVRDDVIAIKEQAQGIVDDAVEKVIDMTATAHQISVNAQPTVTKTGGDETPINLDFGMPAPNGIVSIRKTQTSGLNDTYKITFTNNNTFEYVVKNGKDGVDGQDGQDGEGLPTVTSADNGKIAQVVNGEWTAADLDAGVSVAGKKFRGRADIDMPSPRTITVSEYASFKNGGAEQKIQSITIASTTISYLDENGNTIQVATLDSGLQWVDDNNGRVIWFDTDAPKMTDADYAVFIQAYEEISQESAITEDPNFTAGTALAVIDKNSYTPHTTPYLHRISPSGKRCEYDVIGGTLGWNQYCNEYPTTTTQGITLTNDGNGKLTASGASSAGGNHYFMHYSANRPIYQNHKYFVTIGDLSADNTAAVNFRNRTTNTNYVNANIVSSHPQYVICNAADDGIMYYYLNFPNANTTITGTICPMVIDLTTLLGSTIADYAYSLEQATAGSGIAWLKSFGFLTKSYYPYCEPTLESVQATERVATEADGTEHTYPLGNTTLRGILKLDSNNNIYYDGDIYKADGSVTRRFGVVDLGSLNFNKQSDNLYYCLVSDMRESNSAEIVTTLPYTRRTDIYTNWKDYDKVYGTRTNYNRIYFKDTSYATADAFKTAMSGVYLVYELAAPTTESADPFTPIQYTGSTEAFTTENDVPVGVDAKYYTDLTLPKLPTANGTYTLKCTVTDGTGIVSWVSE